MADDLRFLIRSRRCMCASIEWRIPTAAERQAIDAHPVLGRFGDETIGVADVGGRRWIVRERDWYGWPDPPRYVLFVLESETIRVARNFNDWPATWHLSSLQECS